LVSIKSAVSVLGWCDLLLNELSRKRTWVDKERIPGVATGGCARGGWPRPGRPRSLTWASACTIRVRSTRSLPVAPLRRVRPGSNVEDRASNRTTQTIRDLPFGQPVRTSADSQPRPSAGGRSGQVRSPGCLGRVPFWGCSALIDKSAFPLRSGHLRYVCQTRSSCSFQVLD
jgi:hypothetical protein